mgnify:CR=1 FL=1
MNFKLILQLSLLGLAMAIASVFWIPQNIEPLFWLPIFIFCAYMVAKKCRKYFFLHGLLISCVNSIYITAAHIYWVYDYLNNHPKEAEMLQKFPEPMNIHPRLDMALTGPVIGIGFGIILGIFCFAASKMVKRNS